MNLRSGSLDLAGKASPPIPDSVHLLQIRGMSEAFSRLNTNPADRVARISSRRMFGKAFENARAKAIFCWFFGGRAWIKMGFWK
jgi:hypothetical protein